MKRDAKMGESYYFGYKKAGMNLAGATPFIYEQSSSFRLGYEKAVSWLWQLNEIAMPERSFTAASALTAGLFMGGIYEPVTVLFGCGAIVCTYCCGAVYNNIKDIEADRINDPSRPLASGAMSERFAWTLMLALFFCGMTLAYLVSPILAIACLFEAALGVVYSKFTKGWGVWAYATLVTTHMAVPFIAAQQIAGALGMKSLLIVMFFFVTEILAVSIKDYKDVEGDRKTGMLTLPILMGPKDASSVTFFGLCLPLIFVWIPWMLFHLSWEFIVMYVGIGVFRIMVGRKLLKDQSPRQACEVIKNFRLITTLEMIAWCLS